MRALPEKVTSYQIGNHSVCRDEAGFLMDPQDWTKDVAIFIAQEENIALSDEHWAVIQFIRAYLDEHLIAPDARFAFAFLADHQNLNKKEARRKFFEMFPYGYVKQACKIAGLQQPRAWSTG